MGQSVPPLKTVLIEVAHEHEHRAAALEDRAFRRMGGDQPAPGEAPITVLFRSAHIERQRAIAARGLAEGLRF